MSQEDLRKYDTYWSNLAECITTYDQNTNQQLTEEFLKSTKLLPKDQVVYYKGCTS